MEKYNHRAVEAKWQQRWEEAGVFAAKDLTPARSAVRSMAGGSASSSSHPLSASRSSPSGRGSNSVYVLDMFPYPSSDGLHVGHPEGYTASDIVARYMRMNGKNVLHPMGWDAFGLPAENAAIKKGVHPRIVTEQNVNNFKRQIKSLGFSYDWSREVNTTDPRYYKWTQWIFLQLFKMGLAYEAEVPIWWCPKDKTGLANEEVVNGCCERCGTKVERKKLRQWLLRITKYADRLLAGLEKLDWPESIKALQRNWIGKSEGAEVVFEVGSMEYEVWGKGGERVADTMQFVPELVPLVLNGSKFKTYRFFEPKNVRKGDSVEFINASTKESFAMARITKVEKRNFIDIPLHDKGHEPDVSIEARRKRYEGYYKKIVNNDTPVWIYSFILEKTKGKARFRIKSGMTDKKKHSVPVFTTRPDTLFGATYLVLSPEHPLVDMITSEKQKKAVEKYKKDVASKTDLERTSLEKEKTGVFTGAYAVNPVNNEKIPVWIADYVLMSYGTGAIMAVPAHDERDYEFAKKFKLPILKVIKPPSVMPKNPVETIISPGGWGHLGSELESDCWTGEGTMVNSGKFDGLLSEKGRKKIIEWLEHEGKGRFAVNYKLRDWVFSRQRYWGEPIPLVHCPNHGVVPVPEDQLPVLLPDVEKYEPTGTGKSPLAGMKEWVQTQCPLGDGPAERETNTMPQWAGSCWYYLRYLDPKNEQALADPETMKQWLPVDVYVGGAEHAVLHLLYSRFWHMALYDAGVLPKDVGDEPFIKLKNQGLILGPDGEKMSKSRGNVINPDPLIAKFGADSFRMYEMFMGPFEDAKPWSTNGIVGVRRFLQRIWNIAHSGRVQKTTLIEDPNLRRRHIYTASIEYGIDSFKFNTCVSELMKWSNSWDEPTKDAYVDKDEFEVFLKLLSPFAPHISEELWSKLGHGTLLVQEEWPIFNRDLIRPSEVRIAIQVNGKLRGTVTMPSGSAKHDVEAAAKAEPNVAKYLNGKPKKVVYIKDRLLNYVV
ncbi:MAG: leucine--tRNA ligase [Candidatus Kerfeldbacteria bacterium]|nr:leucine--tRNA ligase [Candidatus Kerfeldbacteria bacterium]